MRIVVLLAIFFTALFAALPMALMAYKEGPFPNVAGGFGDQTCHRCHLDNPMNAPGGSLSIAGVPPTYEAARTYSISVTLMRAGMKRGGFEIVARFLSGKSKGKQAGAWHLPDQRLQIIPSQVDQELKFVQHNLAGSRAATAGSNSWTVDWTAPSPAAAPIQFNIAGNAANDDDSPLGDYIYTKLARSLPAK
jgi:hypothetical protein